MNSTVDKELFKYKLEKQTHRTEIQSWLKWLSLSILFHDNPVDSNFIWFYISLFVISTNAAMVLNSYYRFIKLVRNNKELENKIKEENNK